MAAELEVVVVGGGVVGLALARALARDGREVHLLEAEAQLGLHTSSRNSEVIHAGIYYPPGSWKARLCVRGRALLYDYAAAHAIPHRRIGKLVLASEPEELATLDAYRARALENGVDDLTLLDAPAVERLEPAVRCAGALHSPSTGIVDSHALLHALARDARAHGANIVTRSPVTGARVERTGFTLEIAGERFGARAVINCAGLFAQRFAQTIEGLDPRTIPPCYYARGQYFTLRGASPFARLVYPLPSAHGLGIHVTLDLAGQARFGPDVCFVQEVDYRFDTSRRSAFARAIRRYYPALDEERLEPGYVGIRPKLSGEASVPSDFVIQTQREHGVQGLVNLYGVESPGLTAALALAEQVASVVTTEL